MIYYKHIESDKEHTIALVHGFTQNSKIFDEQIEYFKKDYNLILFDLRGHGKSEKIDGPYGVDEYTDDIQEVFDKLALSSIIYWGTHTGTGIGLNLYFRNHRYISKLILEGCVIPGFETPMINKNINRVRKTLQDQNIEHAKTVWLNQSEWFDYMRNNPEQSRYSEHIEIINSFTAKPWKSELVPKTPPNILSKLDQITIPIFAYNGEFDMEEFFIMTDILSKNDNVITKVIDHSGGFPLWENPDLVNKLVIDFLNNN